MNTLAGDYIFKKSQGYRFATLTAYDYAFGRILDEAGLDFLLVGDSLGMVMLGYPDTTQVRLEDVEHHTRAVARGVKSTLLVSDLPANSADTPEEALASSWRLITAGAGAVKIEGGIEVTACAEAVVAAGIPVIGHIGMLPQRVRVEGGYRIKGKTPQEAGRLIEDAQALEATGVFAIVLELVSPAVAEEITRKIRIPTIGIGSGDGCDGQILVMHDLLGLFPWFKPKFVTPKASLAAIASDAVKSYISDVKNPAVKATP